MADRDKFRFHLGDEEPETPPADEALRAATVARAQQAVRELRAKQPDKLITHAVHGMVPKNRLGRQLLTKLKVYSGSEHPHGHGRPSGRHTGRRRPWPCVTPLLTPLAGWRTPPAGFAPRCCSSPSPS